MLGHRLQFDEGDWDCGSPAASYYYRKVLLAGIAAVPSSVMGFAWQLEKGSAWSVLRSYHRS